MKRLNVLALLGYCALIYWLSDQPALPVPMWFMHQDKVHHFLAYSIMGILAWRCVKDLVYLPIIILALISIVFCSLYAVTDEWHQSFIVRRDASWLDWLADTLGASSGVFFCHKLRKNRYFQ